MQVILLKMDYTISIRYQEVQAVEGTREISRLLYILLVSINYARLKILYLFNVL